MIVFERCWPAAAGILPDIAMASDRSWKRAVKLWRSHPCAAGCGPSRVATSGC